jgi:hypothetical protein
VKGPALRSDCVLREAGRPSWLHERSLR